MNAQTHYFTRDVPMGDIVDPNMLLPNMNNGMAIAKFFTATVKDNALSEARGRYVPREVEMVRIIIPGDKHSVVERRIKPSDAQKYPGEYAAFRKMQDFVPDGTPLEAWPQINRAQAEDLKYQNIFTVEQLSQIPDDKLSSLGLGGRILRQHALAFLETSKTGQVPAQLVEENARLQRTVDALTKQLSDLGRTVESLASKSGRSIDEVNVAPAVPVVPEPAPAAPRSVSVVEIPANYKAMGLPALKKLVGKIAPNVPVTKVKDAIDLIEEYQAEIVAV